MNLRWMAFAASAMSLVVPASADSLVRIDPKSIGQASVDYAYPIDAAGRRIGPVVASNPLAGLAREVPSWKHAWDNLAWNLTTDTIGTTVYGPTSPGFFISRWTTTTYYFASNVANDLAPNPASYGAFASRFRYLVLWNPGNGAFGTPSGTGNLVVVFNPIHLYGGDAASGPTGVIGNGLALTSSNLNGGFWNIGGDFSTANIGFSVPHGTAGVLVRLGTNDANGNFVPLSTGNVQMGRHPFMDAADPGFPGTNASSSDAFQWEDYTSGSTATNLPDGIFQTTTSTAGVYSEYRNRDTVINTVMHRLAPAISAVYDENRPLATGSVTFGARPAAPTLMDVTVVPVDDGGNALLDGSNNRISRTVQVPVATDGTIRVPIFYYNDAFGEPRTTKYVVTAKPRGLLRKTTSVWDTTAGAFTFTWDFVSGDIDNDNSITVFDYDKLSTAFDKSSADSDWNTADGDGVAPADSDLDGDEAVTVFDYDILSTNFDLVGDASPLD